jgi:hypothetical protein
VLFLGDPKALKSQIQELIHARPLTLPFTLAVETANGPATLELPTDMQVVALLYVEKRIVARHLVRPGELTAERIAAIVRGARQLLDVRDKPKGQPGR